VSQCLSSHAGVVSKWLNVSNWLSARRLPSTSRRLILRYLIKGIRLKPNSITLASSELAPNMFEAGSCQIPLHSWFGASSELAPNMFGASSEPASVMEFGREPASSC